MAGYDCVTTLRFERGDYTFLAICEQEFIFSPPHLILHHMSFLRPLRTASELLWGMLSATRSWHFSASQGSKKDLGGVYSQCQAECEPKRILTASKVNHIISYLWRTWPDGGKLLSFSTLVRVQLEYCIQFRSLQINRDIGKLERVCQRRRKLVRGPTKRGWGSWVCSV